ncbi:hypothetical protein BC943DRAFT_86775 [Umbelopsis sp. AD052]|nr:hypothetical protein BC943DRAFT_86775 [Umbelopsis sp. AD052]
MKIMKRLVSRFFLNHRGAMVRFGLPTNQNVIQRHSVIYFASIKLLLKSLRLTAFTVTKISRTPPALHM